MEGAAEAVVSDEADAATDMPEPPSLPGPSSQNDDATIQGPPTRTRDFYFLPIPAKRRYHADNRFEFNLFLNIVFGFVSTATVANLYYCQPLLIDFAGAFNVSDSAVSTIPSITQAGYATGLLFITPLGDLVRRRPFILIMLSVSMLFSMAVALAPNLHALQALSYFLGIASIAPQILIPFAGDLAPPERRSTVLAIVLSGLLLGIIFARAIAGIIAQASGSWRNVFWVGMGLQGIALILMWLVLPDWPSKVEQLGQAPGQKKLTYPAILISMGKLSVTEPVLIQGCLIGLTNQMVFSSFWVTLTFLLSGTPYNFSTLDIGVFGFVGALGVFTAPFVGRLLDGLVLWFGAFVSLWISLASQVIMTSAAGIDIGAVIVSCFALDIGLQMQQVALTSKIYAIDPALRARLNAVYMIACFIGQVAGSAAGSHIFLRNGWHAAYGASVGFIGFGILVLLAKGPHSARYAWIGWDGGAKLAKHKPPPQTGDVELARHPSTAAQREREAAIEPKTEEQSCRLDRV